MAAKKKIRSRGWYIRTSLISLAVGILLYSTVWMFVPDPDADDSAGYVMPGTLTRDYRGWDVVEFSVFTWRHNFVGQGGMVVFAYDMALAIVGLLIILFGGIVIVMRRSNRQKRDYDEVVEKYGSIARELLFCEENYSRSQIESRLQLEENYGSETIYFAWLMMLRDLHVGVIGKNTYENRNNLQHLVNAIGLIEFCENMLTNGLRARQYVVIQYLRQLHIEMPTSIVMRLMNDKNVPLHKVARYYYMTLNNEDAYMPLDRAVHNAKYSDWDVISIHDVVKNNKARGYAMPAFVSYINQAHDLGLKMQVIVESGFWVDANNMEDIVSHINDDRVEIRMAIYQSITNNKYLPAEQKMIDNYWNEPVRVQIMILKAIMVCRSGKQSQFLLDALRAAKARSMRRELLAAMSVYSPESQANYAQLKLEAKGSDEEVIFQQIDELGNYLKESIGG